MSHVTRMTHDVVCIYTHTHIWHACTQTHTYDMHVHTHTHMTCMYTHTHTYDISLKTAREIQRQNSLASLRPRGPINVSLIGPNFRSKYCNTLQTATHSSPKSKFPEISGDLELGFMNLDLRSLANEWPITWISGFWLPIIHLYQADTKKQRFRSSGNQINPDWKIGMNLLVPSTYEQLPGDY